MSTLQNEMIMEDLFDECLCELEQQGYNINKDTTQAVAAYRAQLRFDDMYQFELVHVFVRLPIILVR